MVKAKAHIVARGVACVLQRFCCICHHTQSHLHSALAPPPLPTNHSHHQQVCFTAVRDVLAKTGVHPRQVGCVIVNCSLFNPTPSLSAMIMNHFKMSSNVTNYNLGGMGCSGARTWPGDGGVGCTCDHFFWGGGGGRAPVCLYIDRQHI